MAAALVFAPREADDTSHGVVPRAPSTLSSPTWDNAEAQVMRRIRDGEVAAFELLYRTFFVPLWEFARRYVQSADVAQDVVQDVLIALWERRTLLTGQERIPPYLYAAVRYRALDAVRQGRVRQASRDLVAESLPQSHAFSTEAGLAESEAVAAAEQALSRLPEGPRRVLLLRWKHGLSFAEIAEALGISEGAAKVQATRGRQALAPYLRELLTPE